ncbi:RagB/SusD family nutrient uptake outer membrane protein [Mongoliitalea lutea]|uniref:Membrane protein n=1 Tax=Mongoliitalea lutea TaxID=849756 RepID=A0A8J3CYN1_9BACT|nr:RagB/SusD family nutrient uptake outer membrane protein [Mongoliitalea lutea]GHB35296.1 membrane protein [Mongoliitalea lutea]
MKYIKLFVVSALIAVSACTDVLDVDPRQSLTPQTAFSDVSGYTSLTFSMYARLRDFGFYGQTMVLAPEALADNLLVIANTGRYVGEEVNQDRSHINLWNLNNWSAINDANLVIAGVDGVPGDQNTKNRLKGEAFFVRALVHFDQARVFGYEPGREVNGFNLSAILRTTPTAVFSDADLRPRSTNVQVYEQIEADLLEAINLLPVANRGSANVYRANRAAAQALLARVYLYWGRNDRAIALATDAMSTAGIGNDGSGLLEAEGYMTGFNTFPNPESLFEIEIRQVDWSTVDGVNNSVASLANNDLAQAQFVVSASQELINSHEPGDARLSAWRATTRSGFNGTVHASLKWRGAKGNFLENLPVLRASELLLIRAEARQKTGDTAGAYNDINALRSKRNLGPLTPGLTGNDLFEAILHERRVELAFEGHRFFDLKRNGLDIRKHRGLPTVPYTDYRVLSFLPNAQILLNENLVQNPGY